MKNWSQLKAQMATYCGAVKAADTAHCRIAEPEELQNIWDQIVLGEYIEPDSKVTTGAISLEVMDCFNKHLFLSCIFNDQAKETTNAKLAKEIHEATAASALEEQCLPSYSTKTGQAHRKSTPHSLVHFAMPVCLFLLMLFSPGQHLHTHR
jgi:hypothetical protein